MGRADSAQGARLSREWRKARESQSASDSGESRMFREETPLWTRRLWSERVVGSDLGVVEWEAEEEKESR